MAVDEALLEGVGSPGAPPILRLYAWDPPCLSLGYAQPVDDVDLQVVKRLGWDIVRRPTGGRAILHTDELTYSVIAPIDHPAVSGDILSSYRRLSRGLTDGLEMLGIQVHVEPAHQVPAEMKNRAVCFEVPSPYELTVAGKKILGSAQVRRKHAVLQHGTLPLKGDIARITTVLSYPGNDEQEAAAASVRSRATNVESVLGREIPWEEAADALAQGFSEALGWRLKQTELEPAEMERAQTLVTDRYADREWLKRN